MLKRIINLYKRHAEGLNLLGTLLAGFATGAYAVYHFAAADVPEIKQSLEKVAVELRAIRGDLLSAEVRQRADFNAHVSQEQGARDRMDNSMKVVKAHLIALKQRVEKRPMKPSELNELLSEVRDVSTTAAAQLSPPQATPGSVAPQMPSAVAEASAKGTLRGDLALTFKSTKSFDLRAPTEQQLARALVTKNAIWAATSDGLRFTYDGGSMIFGAKPNVTKLELEKQAELFNSLSEAVSSWDGIGLAPDSPKKPPPPNSDGKYRAPSMERVPDLPGGMPIRPPYKPGP